MGEWRRTGARWRGLLAIGAVLSFLMLSPASAEMLLLAGAAADLVVLDQEMAVEYTCIAGEIVYARDSGERL